MYKVFKIDKKCCEDILLSLRYSVCSSAYFINI